MFNPMHVQSNIIMIYAMVGNQVDRLKIALECAFSQGVRILFTFAFFSVFLLVGAHLSLCYVGFDAVDTVVVHLSLALSREN